MTVLLQSDVSSITAERRMSLEWQARSGSLAWSNPVSWWWGLLTLVSGVNIAVWFVLYRELPLQPIGAAGSASGLGAMLTLRADCGPGRSHRRHCGLSGVSDDDRRPDVSQPLADRRCRWRQAADAPRGPARRQHALGGDARPCRVEGRDCLDVALFQPGGLVQPRAVRVLRARKSSAAIPTPGGDRQRVA